MKRNTWAVVAIWLAVVFFVCVLLGAGILFAGMSTGYITSGNWYGFSFSPRSVYTGGDDYMVDFDAPLPAQLSVAMISVDVRVVTDDTLGDNIKVHFEGRRSGSDEHRIEMQNGFNEVTFKQVTPLVSVGWGNSLSGVLTVYMPSSGVQRMSLSNVSGEITVDGVTAERAFDAGTVSGDIRLEGVNAGDISLNTISGGITADIGASYLEAGTVSGDIRIVNASGANATLSSTSGRISYGAPTLEDVSVRASSVSGSIRVGGDRMRRNYNSSGSSGRIEANTVSGSIDIE